MIVEHQSVPGDLGENAGGGNAEALGVAFYNSCLRRGEAGHGVAVDKCVLRGRRKLSQRFVHRTMRSLEDIDLVDDRGVDNANAETDLSFRVDGGEEFLTGFLGELL